MRIVRLTVPFRQNRTVLNAGERVGLPDDLAERLVSSGQAQFDLSEVVVEAVEGPPADKLMRPKGRKYFAHRSRREAPPLEDS